MKHDTIAVHKFMSVILPQIKQILQICSHAITLAMVQALNIKTTKTLPTFAITKLTLECMLSGIFLLVVMEKVLVMASVAVKCLAAHESLQIVSYQTITSSNEMFN